MMTKKDFQMFADSFADIKNAEEREIVIMRCIYIFSTINPKFSEKRFREWINRRIKGESVKGLG